jgi:hypothetical protein
MDHVLASKAFKPHEIRSVNYCRLYLQAVMVSSIANALGTRLADGALTGDTSSPASTTKWHSVGKYGIVPVTFFLLPVLFMLAWIVGSMLLPC